MVELSSEHDEKIWKKFLRKHWKMLVLFVGAAILAIAGAILVFLWFVGDAQVNESCTRDCRFMDNRISGDFFVTFNFLGSSFHRHPGNYYRSSSIFPMVEKNTG